MSVIEDDPDPIELGEEKRYWFVTKTGQIELGAEHGFVPCGQHDRLCAVFSEVPGSTGYHVSREMWDNRDLTL